MYCSKCGGLLNSEMKVCPNCGNVISTLESASVNTAENSESFNQSSIANAANSDTIINTTSTVNTNSLEENAVLNNNSVNNNVTNIAENATTTETSINTNNAANNGNSQVEKQKFNVKKPILIFISGIIFFVLVGIIINILGWVLPDKSNDMFDIIEEEKTFDIRHSLMFLLKLFQYLGSLALSFVIAPIFAIKEATKKNK